MRKNKKVKNCCSQKKGPFRKSKSENKKWIYASTEVWIEWYGWKDGNGKIVACVSLKTIAEDI